MRRTLGVCVVMMTLAACSGAKTSSESHSRATLPDETASTDPGALTRTAAVTRSRQIVHVGYSLWFRVNAEDDEFEGRTTANFDLRKKGKDVSPVLAMDFDGGTISKLELNGTLLTVTRDDHAPVVTKAGAANTALYNGHQFFVNTSELRVGPNRLDVTFTHPYSHSSHGLTRYRDPADGESYIYTDFEPYFAHQLFPCFDQPDLKARFELTVEAPKAWTVISNTMEKETTGVSGMNSWTFLKTPPLSTYLFALHAGPFASWKSTAKIFRQAPPDKEKTKASAPAAKSKDDVAGDQDDYDEDSPGDEGLPIRLFARKSIAKYVNSAEWLRVTAKGLKFYSDLFDYPFPYGKYDQILLPEFVSEAMENAGAVTVSDDWVSRSEKETEERKLARANLILHEAAHHWFGDLVTMKWWNGLWLNESFAELMAAWSANETTDFKGSWRAFNLQKQGAYEADQLVTTHPIDAHVPDTEHAFASFDEITYGKGAAALRQLIAWIGEDQFKDGIQRYFAKYAGKNTTISDFIHSLSEASAKDLHPWEQTWLQSPGANTVRADWACEIPAGSDPAKAKPVISKFVLQQGNAEMSTVLRAHRMEIAFLKTPNAKTNEKDLLQVNYGPAAETQVPQAIGRPCPALIVLNHGDLDYVKVLVDPISQASIRESLSQISDPLTRQMFWFSLWEMVEDGSLRAQDYADIALKQLPTETDTPLARNVIDTLVDPSGRISVLKILDGKEREAYQAKFEQFTRQNLLTSRGGSDRQLIWFFGLLNSLHSPDQATWVHRVLDGKAKVHGLKIDQERRWELIEALARTGAPDTEELIKHELGKDPTESGKKSAIDAEVARPDEAVKKKWLARMTDFLEKRGAVAATVSQTPAQAPAQTLTATLAPSPAPSAAPSPWPANATASPTPAATESPAAPAAPAATDLIPSIGSPELREAMLNYHWVGQEELSLGEADAYFAELPKIAAPSAMGLEAEEIRSAFVSGMFPTPVCQKSIIERTTKVLDANPALPAFAVKSLKINRQQTERCLRARERSAGSG